MFISGRTVHMHKYTKFMYFYSRLARYTPRSVGSKINQYLAIQKLLAFEKPVLLFYIFFQYVSPRGTSKMTVFKIKIFYFYTLLFQSVEIFWLYTECK